MISDLIITITIVTAMPPDNLLKNINQDELMNGDRDMRIFGIGSDFGSNIYKYNKRALVRSTFDIIICVVDSR